MDDFKRIKKAAAEEPKPAEAAMKEENFSKDEDDSDDEF